MKPMISTFFLSFFLFLTGFISAFAQKISDGQTSNINGISVSITITGKETVEIKGKNYERYKVTATAKNNSGKSFYSRETSYPEYFKKTKGIEFNCTNATGLRLTTKQLVLRPQTHTVKATIQTYDNTGKSVSKSYNITAGYYFDPEDTLQGSDIFIVPAGEKPDFSVVNSI